MEKILSERTVARVFNFLSFIMFALLFHYALQLTGVNLSVEEEYIYFLKDSILFNVIQIAFAVAVLYFFGKLSFLLQTKMKRNILLAVGCAIAAGISFYWVMNSGTEPQADQEFIVDFADSFNKGEFESLQKGEYMAMNSQQLGMVTFLRLFFRVFGAGNYRAFQLFAAAMVPVTVFAGCMIVRELSNDDARVEMYYMLLAVTCFPMYVYTAYVYNDLVSIPFVLLAVWGVLSCIRKFKVWKLVGIGGTIGVAVMLRFNVIIVATAMVIVVLVKLIAGRDRQRKWHVFFTGCSVVVGILLFQIFIGLEYSQKKGEDAFSTPPLCYVAMGLNDDGISPGWYNWDSVQLFADSDYDVKLANKNALASIKEYINIYKANPRYMVDFFTRKMNAQWNAPMYQCLVMNNKIVREQSALVGDIYFGGKVGKFVERYAKLYQLLVYASILFLLANRRKRWDEIEKYILLIAIFGGFLFSLIWEAKARYAFPYFLIALPCAALGINDLCDGLRRVLPTKENKKNEGNE